ncbi:protein terminal ear1 [Andrographis paniculata]|uniref:protein terminal ear1 n=1 Tax=Andrographis paniculata TaxID=175694 RepID=UPI0021E93EEE|nr:protein terminal ear1 [Andrographis paniculata]
MNEPGFPGFPPRHLDPAAQEFIPAASFAVAAHPQIFFPYPQPAVYDIGYGRPAFVAAAAPPPAEPPPPLPVSLPPSSATPSRTLLLSMVPASVSESTVRRELEVFGDVRAVQMERRREGLVTVHFYDVRDAQAALVSIQEQHMQQQFRLGRHYEAVLSNSVGLAMAAAPLPPQAARGLISGRVVWAQYINAVTSGLPDGNNQGTIVIFNLDSAVSSSHLQQIFQQFGPVKELRDTPNKRNQRFVEFYDVRNAAKAMAEMNGKEIFGKNLVIEFSRPGGHYCKKFWRGSQNNNDSPRKSIYPNSPNYHHHHNQTSPVSPTRRPESRHFLRAAAGRSYRSRGNPSGGGSGSKSSSSGASSIHESVSNLCINDECSSGRISRKNNGARKGESSAAVNHGGGGRPWKGGGGRHGKDHDPRFLINEDAIMVDLNCSRDSRTTVMIKNIPNKYSQKLLLNMLDNHCIHCNEQLAAGDGGGDGGEEQPLSAYDFVYLPIDFINKCNVGYGFVNMTSPEATLRLYKAFHHQNWEVFNSRKICEVTYARLQGLEALREHFKNSKFPDDAEEYMPVVFNPPRDGRTLTEPVPIIGRPPAPAPALLLASPSPSSPASSKAQSDTTQVEEDGDDEEDGGVCRSSDD